LITEKKIPKYLRDNYPSIGTIFNTEKIHAVNINSINYLIEAEKGKFILKNFFCDVNRVKKISTILNACQNYTDSIPKIISTKSGKLLESKYKCYLIQFMNGSSFVHSKLNLRYLAQNLAQLHKILNRLDISLPKNDPRYKILTQKELKYIEKKISNRNSIFDKKMKEKIALIQGSISLDSAVSKIIKPKLSNQLIHNDLHIDNVLFDAKSVNFIDFDSMVMGDPLTDIAFAALRFSDQKSGNISKIEKSIEQFLGAYIQIKKIDKMKLSFFNYFMTHEIIRRLSFIIRQKYFNGSDMWISDFDKFVRLLSIAHSIQINQKNII
jgi:Ser/Thr protein kinase RdoA (MazF antagonist)